MTDLLQRALAAHGGMKRWREIESLGVRFSAGGSLFTSKSQRRALHDREAVIDLARARATFSPFPHMGRRGVFEPERVWIETTDQIVLSERREPRAAFRTLRRRLWWDPLDVLYFGGYALWNYLCCPFLLASPGFEVREIGPWDEGGERWHRLEVRFPATVPTHCREQTYYFDDRGLLRRLDYTAELVGSWARAAHYCFDYQTFAGLAVPTLRRVLPRQRDGRARRGPTLVWIKVTDVTARTKPTQAARSASNGPSVPR